MKTLFLPIKEKIFVTNIDMVIAPMECQAERNLKEIQLVLNNIQIVGIATANMEMTVRKGVQKARNANISTLSYASHLLDSVSVHEKTAHTYT